MPQTPIAVPNSANPSLDGDSFAEMPVIVCLDPRGSKTYGVMQPQVAPVLHNVGEPVRVGKLCIVGRTVENEKTSNHRHTPIGIEYLRLRENAALPPRRVGTV
jgi:hypothetical protein